MDVVIAPSCEICGRAVVLMSDGQPRKTCSTACRRESQSRHISAYRNRTGQQDCTDKNGRLPHDPSPEHIERCCTEFRRKHLAELRAKG